MAKALEFQCRQSPPLTQIFLGTVRPDARKMDKIAALKEILALEPNNTLARYGLAMEFSKSGKLDAALTEFDALLTTDPNYTAGYYASAQTLSAAGRTAEAIARLQGGIESAHRSGNNHAVSTMQSLLEELNR
jgi:tetratricopeptide (TPR) repeat protein